MFKESKGKSLDRQGARLLGPGRRGHEQGTLTPHSLGCDLRNSERE